MSLKEVLTFIVQEGEMGKALGKKKIHVLKLEKMLNRKIKIVEFNSDVVRFVRNCIYPSKADAKMEDKTITLTSPDTKTRGYLIGRNASALRNLEGIVKRYFEIDEIKVI